MGITIGFIKSIQSCQEKCKIGAQTLGGQSCHQFRHGPLLVRKSTGTCGKNYLLSRASTFFLRARAYLFWAM